MAAARIEAAFRPARNHTGSEVRTMIVYEPMVIEEMAERLYWRAHWVKARYALIGVFLGIAGVSILSFIGPARANDDALVIFGLLLSALGGVVGGFMGWGKGFDFRVRAQTMLLQKRIEENTRYLCTVGGGAPGAG
jgi:hypothetical protein